MPDRLTRLLLTTDAVGGVWRYSIDLARGLVECGVEPVLAVLGPSASSEQLREAKGVQVVQTGLDLDWTAPDEAALEHAAAKLSGLAALLGVAGVHLHAPALMGRVRWPAPVVVVAHSCVGTWWRAMREGPRPADFAWRIAATGAGLRAAQAVIAPSRAHAEALRAVYGALDIQVVHNGAAPPVATGVVRQRGVFTAGRLWDEAKGVALLDRPGVRAAGPTQGPNGAAVALHRMTLLGSLDPVGMAREYAEASVYASMARYEPFGLSVLEAALSGLRLVLSDIPTFRELWDGVATFTDPGRLNRDLDAALDSPGDGGARDRAARYTLEAMVSRTLAVHRGRVLA